MAKKKSTESKSTSNDGEKKTAFEVRREYEELLDRLKYQRDQLEDEMKREYYNARRYVRSHPEEGVLLSFAGGLLMGILIGKLTK